MTEDSHRIDCRLCVLRPWDASDAPRLAHIANDRRVSRYLTDRFPFPYTLDDARWWIARCSEPERPTFYAIVVDGEVAGGCGYAFGNYEHSHSAEIGY